MKKKSFLCILLAGSLLAGCQNVKQVESNRENDTQAGTSNVGDYRETEQDQEVNGRTQEETEQETQEVSLVMVGDVLLHTPVAESGRKEDGSYEFHQLFEHVDAIRQADIAIANQEVIIGGEELGITGYPCFNAPYELGDALSDAGFDIILHATNHALDKGRSGLVNCLDYWKTQHPDMTVLGIHDSQESQNDICIYEKNGIRIAFLNYTYGTNGIALPADMPYGIDYLEEDKVISDLQQAEEQADFTVVCPHWGTEYELAPTEEQKYWAEIFAENGADLVIGTHPHVIEPVEWYGEAQKMLVYYSLGNFVNWTSDSGSGIANRMVGGMAEVTLAREEDGQVRIQDYDVEPLVSDLKEGVGGVTVYPLSDYTEEMAEQNEIRKQDPDFSLQYCKDLCEHVWNKQ